MDFDSNQSFARRAEIKVSCTSNISPRWCYVQPWNQMEISLVTYGFNKDREGIEHLKWICDPCYLSHSVYWSPIRVVWQVTFICTQLCKGKKNWKCDGEKLFEWSLLSLLCFIIYGQGSFEKGLMWTVSFLVNCVCFVTPIVCTQLK